MHRIDTIVTQFFAVEKIPKSYSVKSKGFLQIKYTFT